MGSASPQRAWLRQHRRLRWAGIGLFTLLATLLPIASVQAIHSLPQPYLWYWDIGNDGIPDPAPTVDLAGNGWTTLAIARVDGAISAWNGTHFKPKHVVSGPNDVDRDGTILSLCNGGVFPAGSNAVTCIAQVLRHLPGAPPDEFYHDISQTWTFFQTDANLPLSEVRYWYGASQSTTAGDLDFQGILTHELGHWLLLEDLGPAYGSSCNYGTGIYTMCGQLTDPGYEDQSYRQRSLTSDDISAANIVY